MPTAKEGVIPLPQPLLKGLPLVVLTLVVVGCTSGGGLSNLDRQEIDVVLNTFLEGVRSGEPSLMADALAEKVALGVSADDFGSVPKEAIVERLEGSVKGFIGAESLSAAAQSGNGLHLEFVDRRTRGRRREGWVRGVLSVQETVLPVEVGLTKTGSGWRINGLRLLLTPQGTPDVDLTGDWSGEWWRVPRGTGEGELMVKLDQDLSGNLSGEVHIKGYECFDKLSITEGHTRSSPFRWAVWTAATERGAARFITIDVQDNKMTGTITIDAFACPPAGWFELQR